MRRTALCVALLAVAGAGAGPAAASLPRPGVLVPGRSLGGIRLGETATRVERALGRVHGVCRGCPRTTWYFTYRRFDAHGLAVEFARGRVSAVYTVWQPAGWHASPGLSLGAKSYQVTAVTGPLLSLACAGYTVLVQDSGTARTAYYLLDDRLWGFGLLRRGADPCR
jgi:hypothetical protein